MLDVYNTLSKKQYFIENEYLQKYSRLVEMNRRTVQRSKSTHKHHIIPKSWFKLTKTDINNELNNLVNLPYKEHCLAHYYLCLCTEDPFKFANQLALVCLISSNNKNNFDKHLLYHLPLYNNIYEDYVIKLKSSYRLYERINDDN